ncbi:MAG TPA: molybdate ABC transporter permease subunit [Candidatus Kapabacteria bacterium]|nr:molybdate ABC transporter permease subunit [Candidatus Kapabacteria bacterium]
MVWDALGISLKVALVSTCVVGIVGGLIGRHLARHNYHGKVFLDALLMAPMFVPPTVLGYYLTLLFGPKAPLGSALASIGIEVAFTWLGAALASAVVALPIMVRAARIAFESIDREVEDAAAIDGAGRWRTLLHIALPLARNGLISGAALAFARAVGEFGATLMLSGNIPGRTQTIPLAIYEAFATGDDNAAMTLSILLTVVSLVVITVSLRLGHGTSRW